MSHGDFHHHRSPTISPTSKTVQFLCPTCHRKYGHTRKVIKHTTLMGTEKEVRIIRHKVRRRNKIPTIKKKAIKKKPTKKKTIRKKSTKKKSRKRKPLKKKTTKKTTKKKSRTKKSPKRKSTTRKGKTAKRKTKRKRRPRSPFDF